MMRIEGERAFVIQDRLAEIPQPKPGVPQIVERVCVALPGVDEILVVVDRLLEMSFAVILVRLRTNTEFCSARADCAVAQTNTIAATLTEHKYLIRFISGGFRSNPEPISSFRRTGGDSRFSRTL